MEAVPEYTVIEAEPGEDIRLTTALGLCQCPAHPSRPPGMRRWCSATAGNWCPPSCSRRMMLWYGVTPEEVKVRLGSDIRLGDKLTIPINRAGAMLVDWKQPFDRVGFDDLVLAEDQIEGKHATVIDPGHPQGPPADPGPHRCQIADTAPCHRPHGRAGRTLRQGPRDR